jgi:two-component system cell cycle sensor histidine kinase PleC
MASMTCADPREGVARTLRANWANLVGRSMRRAVNMARRWLPPHSRWSAPAALWYATSRAAGGQQRHPATRAQLGQSEIAIESHPAVPPHSAPALTRRATQTLNSRAFGDLLAHVSHELRTPLNAVIGFSDVMQRELFGPLGDARYQEYVRHIRDSGDALLRAAEDTLAMTTLVVSASQSAADRVGLSAMFASVWNELIGRSAARGAALELAIASDIEIRADARAMRQALKHLLAAALARARRGAAVRVTAVAAHGRVRIELLVPEIEPAHLASPGMLEPGSEDLAICLARTLLEMQGSTLTDERRDRGWVARTEVEHAVQEDFFARSPCGG